MKNAKKKTEVNTVQKNKIKVEKRTDSPIDDNVVLIPGNEADLTEEDMEALGPEDLSMDLGDDEDLKHRIYPVDFSGNDLDIPGAELDDDDEFIGSEDEENNSYSIGGDAHDNLEGEVNS